ncbi:MAG: hypothetical protein BroJett021_23930 [Chloroflexota bacterium]|nr:MAG: hypothetical protein BroJett021_23930 [Chloroflexota bacterium]
MMESAIGLLTCLLLLLLLGGGVGFLMVNQRINRLQKQIEQIELRLTAGAMFAPESVEETSQFIQPMTPAPPVQPAPTRAADVQANQLFPIPAKPQSLPQAASPIPAPASAPVKAPRKPIPVVDWFLKSHILVQIGLIVLFIGVALLLRYAVDQGWLSLEIRHIGAAVGGVTLGVVGWLLRKKQRSYGLALEGGGLAILYLTTFSAYQFYALLPAPVAFGVFVALGGVGMALALLQNARILAYAALIGAFAAPLLAAGEGGSYIGLFGYYALLVIVALGLSVRKGWQGLGVIGLIFTYSVGIGFTFANDPVRNGDYPGMQGFVALFFGLFAVAALLFALRHGEGRRISDLVIGVLNPLFALLWQMMLVIDFERGAGYSLLVGGALYLGLFGLLLWRKDERLSLHRELSLFWALFLLTLAIPVFVEAQITAAIWAVAGAAWVWIGWRRAVGWLAPWGVITQIGAGLAFAPTLLDALGTILTPTEMGTPFLNEFTLGWVMLGAAGIASAYFLTRPAFATTGAARASIWRALAVLSLAWGVAWWFGGGALEATTVPAGFVVSTLVLFLTLSTVVMALIGWRLAFGWLELPLRGLLPLLLVLAVVHRWEIDSPLEGGAWLAWPLALLAHVWMLRRNDGWQPVAVYHAAGVWLVTYLAAAAANGLLGAIDAGETWQVAAVFTMLAAVIAGITAFAHRLPTPFNRHVTAYRVGGVGLVAVFGALLLLLANFMAEGASRGLPYLPLLNPLALAMAALLAATIYWLAVVRNDVDAQWRPLLWGMRWVWWALLILTMSAELARSVHHLLGVSLTWDGLYASAIYQTLLAVLWSVTALGLMVWGSRRGSRSSWIAGAMVLGMTVLKLFVVDLAGVGTVARIVSFIGVGLLILLIAFLAPAPQKKEMGEQRLESSDR